MKITAKEKILATIKGNDLRGFRTSEKGLRVIQDEHPMFYNEALLELVSAGLIKSEEGAMSIFYYIP